MAIGSSSIGTDFEEQETFRLKNRPTLTASFFLEAPRRMAFPAALLIQSGTFIQMKLSMLIWKKN